MDKILNEYSQDNNNKETETNENQEEDIKMDIDDSNTNAFESLDLNSFIKNFNTKEIFKYFNKIIK